MNDPTDGGLDLHFSGVGSVSLAQKHTEAIGVISDLEQLPVWNGLKTAERERECKVLGDVFSVSPDEVLGTVFKASRRECSPLHSSVVAHVAQPKTGLEV